MMGMIVSLIMLVVGSNIARAFALVGALSIIRFRNAIKETRDVGFIFFAMAIGMAIGTRFYSLAVVATVAISAAMLIMERFNWFKLDVQQPDREGAGAGGQRPRRAARRCAAALHQPVRAGQHGERSAAAR